MAERWRIFVVEDEESLNRNIVSSLRKDGYTVNGATNGRDAVRILWAEVHDVVVCDLNTPGAEGFELLQWLRAYRPSTQVILIGDANPILRTQALEGGAVGYLEKPLHLHHLKEELRRLLVQTGFSADLDSFDLLDVIQIVSASRKNIALLISTGLEERGMLCFQNGNLVWAEYGMLRGEEAFFALAAHKTGTVVHQPWNQRITPNVTQPLSRLILQALQYRTKYNSVQPSGEHEAVTSSSPLQEDDTPFTVLTEYVTDSIQETFPAQANTFVPLNTSPIAEQDRPGRNDVHGMSESEKEWWEQTGKLHGVRPTHPTPSSVPATPIVHSIGENSSTTPISSSNGHKTPVELHNGSTGNENLPGKHNDLPSWLTDQPTATELPALRPTSTPAPTPNLSDPVTPIVPPSAEWQQSQGAMRTPRKLAEQRVREMTASRKVVKPDTHEQKVASPEWQVPEESTPSGPLQSLTPSRRMSDTHPLHQYSDVKQNGKASSSTALNSSRKNGKRNYNYPELVSALQAIGYSINGFVAAAVADMDGRPIAQVTIDELDMTRMCGHFSIVLKSALQSLDSTAWGTYEDVVITSTERRILLRVVGNERSEFQVLITTREATLTESEVAMSNVEDAIAKAIH